MYSTPNHAYLRQWSKECASLDVETLKSYLATALQPVVIHRPGNKEATVREESTSPNSSSSAVKMEAEESGEGVAPLVSDRRKLTNGDGLPEGSKQPRLSLQGTQKSACSIKMSVLTHAGPGKVTVAQGASGSKDLSHQVEPEVASGDARTTNTAESTLRSTSPEPDFTSEFGVQEMSVFAVKESENVPLPEQQKPTGPPSTKTVTGTPQPPSLPAIPTLPLLTQKKSLQPSTQSAFKPVVIPPARQSMMSPSPPPGSTSVPGRAPTCTSSQLTSLLTSPISSHPQSLVQPPTSCTTLPTVSSQVSTSATPVTKDTVSGILSTESMRAQQPISQSVAVAQPCVTQLSKLKLVPDVNGDLIYAETASSLPPVQDSPPPAPVLLKEFTEAFVHGDTTNWFKRMLLLDHIETVQDGILQWVEQMEREVDGTSGITPWCIDDHLHALISILPQWVDVHMSFMHYCIYMYICQSFGG